MKKIRILQIIELCLLVVIALGLISFLSHVNKNRTTKADAMTFNFDIDWMDKNAKDGKKQKEETVSSKGIEKIAFDFDSADIEVTTTDDDVIRIVESASRNMSERELFTLANDNGVLKVKSGDFPRSSIFNFGIVWHKVQLFVPKNYAGDIALATGSGDININSDLNLNRLITSAGSGSLKIGSSIKTQKFESEAGSGDVRIENMECQEYKIDSGSGYISIKSLKGAGSINASSGFISVDELTGGKYNIHSSSGDITLRNIEGTGKIEASSGDIKAEYKAIGEYTELEASSGEIDIKLADDINFEMNARCSSGEVEGNIPMEYEDNDKKEAEAKVGKEPFAKLNIEAGSGSISVNQ